VARRLKGLAGSGWAWASAAVALATTAVYGALIVDEGDNSFWEVFPWFMIMMIGIGAMLASALVEEAHVSRAFAIAGTLVLGATGLVSIFSVGLGFLIAAGLGGLAAAQADRRIA
jgi:fructose-specific phosphotransferase system IIC component